MRYELYHEVPYCKHNGDRNICIRYDISSTVTILLYSLKEKLSYEYAQSFQTKNYGKKFLGKKFRIICCQKWSMFTRISELYHQLTYCTHGVIDDFCIQYAVHRTCTFILYSPLRKVSCKNWNFFDKQLCYMIVHKIL